ncbi:MAG: PSD1 domain-containing protein [Verrucomicrobiales bacterium]|nr:PSD1 domain-containing protein [Verrucomicrobiales bacterium]
MSRRIAGLLVLSLLAVAPIRGAESAAPGAVGPLTDAQRDFFESRIRPVLIERCHECHSAAADKLEADFRLDTRDGIRKGGVSGRDAVIPGDPAGSQLMTAIRHSDPDLKMPPKGRLPDSVIADFEAWIAMGAPDPRDEAPLLARDRAAATHWAFQPVSRPESPSVKADEWPRDRIDHFILAELEKAGLSPVADADRRTLLRRASLELTGLPPQPEEIRAFLADPAPDREAFAKVVDRLLDSPRFGERWGRHWLDVARYGESSSYSRNMLYPHAWRYRNWVIDAYNRDLSYDRFIQEQLAGDLLPAASPEERDRQIIGTGFLTIGPKTLDEDDITLFQLNIADDMIDATSRAFLALTANCARCHDHKYDPFPTRDYYALAGIFLSSRHLAGTETNTRIEHAAAHPLGPEGEKTLSRIAEATRLADEAQKTYLEIVKKRNAIRDPMEKAGIDWRKNPTPELTAAETEVQRHQSLVREAQAAIPASPDFAMAMAEGRVMTDEEWKSAVEANKKDRKVALPARIADAPFYAQGLPNQPLDSVPRGVPGLFAAQLEAPAIASGESGRLQLARWLTDPRHPLTARVYVNRVWHHLFGAGLVPTVDNFGLLGETPSHPALLDDLARRFTSDEMQWSTKRLIRTLLLSRAWMLDSTADPARHAVDPANRLLWRFSPQPVEAEALRDSLLFVGGQLDLSPLEGSQVADVAKTQPNAQGREIGRRDFYLKDIRPDVTYRSVYLPAARGAVFDAMTLFDTPDPNLVSGARQAGVVPAQSLFLMNGPLALAAAAGVAARLPVDADIPIRIADLFERLYGRSPRPEEMAAVRDFLGSETADDAVWARAAHTLMMAGEFRTIY